MEKSDITYNDMMANFGRESAEESAEIHKKMEVVKALTEELELNCLFMALKNNEKTTKVVGFVKGEGVLKFKLISAFLITLLEEEPALFFMSLRAAYEYVGRNKK